MTGKSAEQQARDLLEQCGVEDAQSFTAGDVVALANFIADTNWPTIEAIQDAVMNNSDGEDIHWDQVATALGLRAAAGLGKPQ